MRDLYSNIDPAMALKSTVAAASANGEAIKLEGFGRIAFVVNTGAIVGAGDFSLKLQESDASDTGFADVAAAQIDTNAPATVAADSVYKLGYRGFKPFVRLVLTKAGGTSIAVGAVAVLGDVHSRPVA